MFDLATAVIEAFAAAPRPAAEDIAPHPYCEECAGVAAYLEGRDPFAFDEEAVRGCV